MPDRVVVFLDWQNVYKGACEAFCKHLVTSRTHRF